jgi:hypothetical protein
MLRQERDGEMERSHAFRKRCWKGGGGGFVKGGAMKVAGVD